MFSLSPSMVVIWGVILLFSVSMLGAGGLCGFALPWLVLAQGHSAAWMKLCKEVSASCPGAPGSGAAK